MSSRPKLRTAKLKSKHCVKDVAFGLRIAEHAYVAQQYGVSHPNTKVTIRIIAFWGLNWGILVRETTLKARS